MTAADPWTRLRAATRARIGLGRCGDGLPTKALLDFQLAHARARDAVHAPFDPALIAAQLGRPDLPLVESQAADRLIYLQRPDLGRRLAPQCEPALVRGEYDAALVIADGLSATAVHRHGAAMTTAVQARLEGWRLAPPVLARRARVALGDEIGARLGVAMVVVLIGERPGLSADDSLGAYLTYGPKPGRTTDAERNCISNIRPPDGLGYQAAAERLAWLMNQARRLRLTGVVLKEDALTGARLGARVSDR